MLVNKTARHVRSTQPERKQSAGVLGARGGGSMGKYHEDLGLGSPEPAEEAGTTGTQVTPVLGSELEALLGLAD